MRKVGVHDDDKGAGSGAQAVDVGGAKAELPGAGSQEDALGGVEALKLGGDFESAVRGGVVDDDDFVVEVAVWCGRGIRVCWIECFKCGEVGNAWLEGWYTFR